MRKSNPRGRLTADEQIALGGKDCVVIEEIYVATEPKNRRSSWFARDVKVEVQVLRFSSEISFKRVHSSGSKKMPDAWHIESSTPVRLHVQLACDI